METARARLVVLALLIVFAQVRGFADAGSLNEAARPIDAPQLAVAPEADPNHLLAGPQVISFTVDTDPPRPATTASIGDLHAVFPVPLAAMRQVVSDYNGYVSFSPRVIHSVSVRTHSDPPTFRQRLTLSFRLLFFGSDYDYYLEVVEPPAPTADEFIMTYRMTESIDGRLAGVAGSWYLKAVTIDGAEHTYARYYNRIDFARDQFGLRLALRNLGANDMRNAMNAFGREAARREIARRETTGKE